MVAVRLVSGSFHVRRCPDHGVNRPGRTFQGRRPEALRCHGQPRADGADDATGVRAGADQLASMDRQSEELLKNFPLDAMLSDMIPIYQRHFTKTEIDALSAFFSSPAGQKYLHEIPAVSAETMKAVYPRIEAEVDALLKRAEEKTASPKP